MLSLVQGGALGNQTFPAAREVVVLVRKVVVVLVRRGGSAREQAPCMVLLSRRLHPRAFSCCSDVMVLSLSATPESLAAPQPTCTASSCSPDPSDWPRGAEAEIRAVC